MRKRFEGKNAEQLVQALKAQTFVGNDDAIARAVAAVGELTELAPGQQLLVRGAYDNDPYCTASFRGWSPSS